MNSVLAHSLSLLIATQAAGIQNQEDDDGVAPTSTQGTKPQIGKTVHISLCSRGTKANTEHHMTNSFFSEKNTPG